MNYMPSKIFMLVGLCLFITLSGCKSNTPSVSYNQSPVPIHEGKQNNDQQKYGEENHDEGTDFSPAAGGKTPEHGTRLPSETASCDNATIKQSSTLKDKTVCIDPGHQSKADAGQEPIAPGAAVVKEKMTLGTAGIITRVPEYQLNLEVSYRLRQVLEEKGARVIMTRDRNDLNLSNIERAEMANSSKADLVLRIHADGAENQAACGISVLYPGGGYISDQKLLEKSKEAAKMILKSLIANTGAQSRGVSPRDDMTGFNWSTVPVILVEMGFMTNPEEDRKMNSKEYQEKIVNGILKGVEEYFDRDTKDE